MCIQVCMACAIGSSTVVSDLEKKRLFECAHCAIDRVLARISKMPVQNSNFKISARPDWVTNLLQILIPTIFYSLLCQKGQFTLQLCPRRWFVSKILGYYPPKVKIEIYS